MKVERYNHTKHKDVLSSWLKARDLSVPDERLFSDLGFVVDDCAIGFLFTTNSRQAYIDHLAADPEVSSSRRMSALGHLFDVIEKEAKDLGFLMITGLAKLDTVSKRLENRDYSNYGNFNLYYKVLGDR